MYESRPVDDPMALRDRFALALVRTQLRLKAPNSDGEMEKVARRAYALTDAMLAARERKPDVEKAP